MKKISKNRNLYNMAKNELEDTLSELEVKTNIKINMSIDEPKRVTTQAIDRLENLTANIEKAMQSTVESDIDGLTSSEYAEELNRIASNKKVDDKVRRVRGGSLDDWKFLKTMRKMANKQLRWKAQEATKIIETALPDEADMYVDAFLSRLLQLVTVTPKHDGADVIISEVERLTATNGKKATGEAIKVQENSGNVVGKEEVYYADVANIWVNGVETILSFLSTGEVDESVEDNISETLENLEGYEEA